jgi:cytochrome bd-type quinol oxidase subunit 1
MQTMRMMLFLVVCVARSSHTQLLPERQHQTSNHLGLQSNLSPTVAAAAAAVAAELRRKWFVQSSQCTSDEMNTNGSGQLHLTQAWSVFMTVAGGAAVGLLLAAGEMLYYRRLYTREYVC